MITIHALRSDKAAKAACQRLTPETKIRCEFYDSFRRLSNERSGPILVGENSIGELLLEDGSEAPVLLLLDNPETGTVPELADRPLVQVIDSDSGTWVLSRTLHHLAHLAEVREQITTLRRSLDTKSTEVEVFSRIGMALGSEHNTRRLLDLILVYARQLTVADSGSIYIIRERRKEDGRTERVLHFAHTQSDTIDVSFQGADMDITERSISGYVALHGEVLNHPDVSRLPPQCPYEYDATFERSVNYRIRSMMTLPMRNSDDEVIGVLQLINKKRTADKPLRPISRVDTEVLAFTEQDEKRALAFGGQAAVALENSILYEAIERLFEGFVLASVKSIESRDPVTAGHTQRVTRLALALAAAINATDDGPYADTSFNDGQMRELRYAALLHDVGKIGVQESVLRKAERLHPYEMDIVKQRFQLIRTIVRLNSVEARLVAVRSGQRCVEDPDRQLAQQLLEIDGFMRMIDDCNTPGRIPEGAADVLNQIAARTYRTSDGSERPYLTEHERQSLNIERGSLTPREYEQIREHVVFTREFLEDIPWPHNLAEVTDIASEHHEMLNGSGYPDGLTLDQLTPHARILAVADIFDAVTAPDRPYKKGMPVEKALAILDDEVRLGRLDADLVKIFVERGVYRHVADTA